MCVIAHSLPNTKLSKLNMTFYSLVVIAIDVTVAFYVSISNYLYLCTTNINKFSQ